MQLGKGVLFLCVVTTVALLSQGALASQDARGHKKNKKRKQQTDITAADPGTNPGDVDNTPLVNTDSPALVDGNAAEDIVPSEAHNGKLGKKQRKEQKKAARKAEKKAAKKAARKEARNEHKHRGDKSARKAAKKAQRKAERKLQKQEEAGTQIVSFDDIVEDRRHGDPIPNPLPPVEGTATESQNAGTAKQNKKAERRQHKNEKRRHNKGVTECESSSDCPHGSCCIEKKGTHYCKPSKKDVGQRCVEDCMCRSGLHCEIEEIAPGKEKGLCRVRGASQVDTGDDIGTLEDAVENVINNNQ